MYETFSNSFLINFQVKDERQGKGSLVRDSPKSAERDVQAVGSDEEHPGWHVPAQTQAPSRIGPVQKRSRSDVGQQKLRKVKT